MVLPVLRSGTMGTGSACLMSGMLPHCPAEGTNVQPPAASTSRRVSGIHVHTHCAQQHVYIGITS